MIVAGIGASAGGLDAFKKFFAAMPAHSGVAFVLIPHLDPTHESLMVELLARQTAMPVVEAKDKLRVEADRVYIIPPNKYMTISGGMLRLTGPVERRGLSTPIDLFLRSLAEDQQEQAICIILSGTGAHGTLGLKAIKANGGMAMVQEPKSAEYDRMPQSAVATGLADFVLPPERMPDALVKFVRHFYLGAGEIAAAEAPDHLLPILSLLRARTKYDFHCYRRKMLGRRIERRMGLHQIEHVPDYLKLLRSDPDEVKLLTRDLFISVTSFFRDPDAFRALENEVLPGLLESKGPDAPIRVWVPGAATGEEPYSIAMLLLEQAAAASHGGPVQIFATDVDDQALSTARQGTYPDSIVADVGPERLARFFTRADENSYQVNKPLREAVIFAVQNLLADPPFSKLDLISCRNLLIYLEPEVQKKVIALLHFALNDGGYLFLGPSETIGRHVGMFESVDKKWRIYRRIGPGRADRVDIPIMARGQTPGAGKRPLDTSGARPVNFADLTHSLLLQAYAPAAVLINRRHEILYFFGATMRYLDQPTGEPTLDIMLLVREGLRTKLRATIHRAIRENLLAAEHGVCLKRDGDNASVTIVVRPIQAPKTAEELLLVTFADEREPSAAALAAPGSDESALVGQLENELKFTREDLQSTIEEMESSAEELKGAHEEVMSMNEELQSANEELETSKEELQSLNEELTTVNSQLQDKVEELEASTNDMANLLNCIDIGTVFLDTSFRIKRFTPAATELFNLIATDVGRPISDIAQKFTDSHLLDKARRVLQSLTTLEDEVATHNGRWCIRRIIPYRTADNRIEGVVIAFVDITARKAGEDALRKLARELEQRIADRTAALEELNQKLRQDAVERRALESEVLHAASLEQQRIGQDLHDSVGQELTGLGLMAENLVETFAGKKSPALELAARISQGLKRSLGQVRILAKGLSPVEVDYEGLMLALKDLSARVGKELGVQCDFRCDAPIAVPDNFKASHLYRIAQEAVTNALKHAQTKRIQIDLDTRDRHLVLKITDDGIGMAENSESAQGMGLKIMRYRAGLINADLTIDSIKGNGTAVTCTMPSEE